MKPAHQHHPAHGADSSGAKARPERIAGFFNSASLANQCPHAWRMTATPRLCSSSSEAGAIIRQPCGQAPHRVGLGVPGRHYQSPLARYRASQPSPATKRALLLSLLSRFLRGTSPQTASLRQWLFTSEVSMFGLLKSVVDLAGDVGTVVLAPVKITVDLAGAAAKPLAEAAKDLAADVKSLKD